MRIFRPLFGLSARAEMLDAAAWYAHRGQGLRDDFIAEADRTLERIRAILSSFLLFSETTFAGHG